MKTMTENIFNNIPAIIPEELFENLLVRENIKIERIISDSHRTSAGKCYDQTWDEWVLLLQGQAVLSYEDGVTIVMQPGDYLLIPAHTRHRVEETSVDQKTVWLAIHFSAD